MMNKTDSIGYRPTRLLPGLPAETYDRHLGGSDTTSTGRQAVAMVVTAHLAEA